MGSPPPAIPLVNRVLHLCTVQAFDRLSAPHLAAIAATVKLESVPKGAQLVRPGDALDALHILIDGRAAITRDGRLVRTAAAGDVIGLVHLLARIDAEHNVRAEEDTRIMRLEWDDLLDLCEQHFPILIELIRHVAERTVRELRRLPAGERLGQPDVAPIPLAGPPLNLVERVLALERSPVFPSSSLDALAELARHVHEVRLGIGDPIWQLGDHAGDLLLIASGTARAEVESNRWHFLGSAGLPLGLHEALCGTPRWFAARVVDHSLVALRVGIEPLFDIMEDHFEMAIDLTSLLARRLIELRVRNAPEPTSPRLA